MECRVVLNEKDNGGEQVEFITTISDNGDRDENSIFYQSEIILNSYGNSASLFLYGLTPQFLRMYADKLESYTESFKLSINEAVTD